MSIEVQEQPRAVVVRFLGALSWAESRQIVEEHPVLLSKEVDVFLDGWAKRVRKVDPAEDQFLLDQRALLRRCREIGIEKAYSEMQHIMGSSLYES